MERILNSESYCAIVSMIQAPYTIAKLPEAPFPDKARIQCADVQSVTGSRKRKRCELAVAIDHSCVNLYDVDSLGSAGTIGF